MTPKSFEAQELDAILQAIKELREPFEASKLDAILRAIKELRKRLLSEDHERLLLSEEPKNQQLLVELADLWSEVDGKLPHEPPRHS